MPWGSGSSDSLADTPRIRGRGGHRVTEEEKFQASKEPGKAVAGGTGSNLGEVLYGSRTEGRAWDLTGQTITVHLEPVDESGDTPPGLPFSASGQHQVIASGSGHGIRRDRPILNWEDKGSSPRHEDKAVSACGSRTLFGPPARYTHRGQASPCGRLGIGQPVRPFRHRSRFGDTKPPAEQRGCPPSRLSHHFTIFIPPPGDIAFRPPFRYIQYCIFT